MSANTTCHFQGILHPAQSSKTAPFFISVSFIFNLNQVLEEHYDLFMATYGLQNKIVAEKMKKSMHAQYNIIIA